MLSALGTAGLTPAAQLNFVENCMDEERGTWLKEAEIVVPDYMYDMLSVDDLDWLWRRYGLVLYRSERIPLDEETG